MKTIARIIATTHPLVKKAVIIIFSVTAIIVVARVAAYHFMPPPLDMKKYSLFSRANYDSFMISWSVNLIFFSVLGIATYWTSSRNPKEDPFDDRFMYLLNSDYMDKYPSLREVKKAEIIKAGCCAEKFDVTVIVKDHYNDKKAFKVEVIERRVYKNLFNEIDYVNDDARAFVVPDQIDIGNGVIGGVSSVSMRVGGTVSDVIDETINITVDDPRFDRFFQMKIPPGDSLNYESRYWIMQKTDGDFWFDSDRYVMAANIYVRNSLRDTKIIISDRDCGCRAVTLPPSEESTVFSGPVEANRRVSFNIGVC